MDEREDETTLLPEFDWMTKLLIKLGGADPDTLRRCPQVEVDNVTKPAWILLLVFVLQSGVYSLVAEHLFGVPGEWHPELDFCGVFIAFFVMVLDSYVIMRAGWYAASIRDLKAEGRDLSGGPTEKAKAGIFLGIRVLLTVGISQLVGIFFMLIVFAHDIGGPIKDEWLRANATLIAAASAPVDAEIKRDTDAVTAETKVNDALRGQITGLQEGELDPLAADPQMQQARAELNGLLSQKADADKAVITAERFASDELAGVVGARGNSGKPGNGPRRRAALEQQKDARDHAKAISDAIGAARQRIDALRTKLEANGNAAKLQAHDQLPVFKQSLEDGETKLRQLKEKLAGTIRARDAAIEAAVEAAPDYVPRNDGLLNRLKILEHITNSDSMLYLIALLIDLVSFGFELAAVLAKVTVSIPSSYGALLVSEVYERIRRIADSIDVAEPPAPEAKPALVAGTARPFSFASLFGVHPAANPANDNEADGQAAHAAANDNQSNGHAATGTDGVGVADGAEQPPKRKRGRPKGSGRVKGPNGSQGKSGTPPKPRK